MSMLTLVAMAAIVLLAAGLALWPLLWGQHQHGLRRRALNVAGYKTRLAEIEADLAHGSLDAEAAEALRSETARRLLDDVEQGSDAQGMDAPGQAPYGVLALGLTLMIAALAGVSYYAGQSRHQAALIAQAQTHPAAAQQRMVAEMLGKLEARLQSSPDDAEGWAMLGRSYAVLQRHDEAIAAYANANRLSAAQPQPEWLADEAELRIFANDHDFRGKPSALLDQVLALAPHYPKALWYGGLASAQNGQYAEAVQRWQTLLQDPEIPDDFRQVLEQRLPELRALAGVAAPAAPAAAVAAAPAAAPRLIVNVSLAPELAGQLNASDTLFVLARKVGGGGPPLAVQRLGAAQLPLQVTLDDSHAMAPGFNLSSADQWDVLARVSRSGTPTAQSGDLQGQLVATRAQSGQVLELVIDQRVP
ncbi:c-type cytochrome biogenesis protein CcmI [Sinimarinibacterium sp. NLF-5-8]|uniref:c-type cytochrome biogenesis protein CcmI n=1 Tax=Sinimarinibacterium sp. NLF-5-8 TaxID=2698684 RepID=UPI00137B99C2|nr:c-type cytochrome biogenesis protein CcmI [Sinimarinibacterium sp. NLF-5-8]QHS08689.1 c-type cytochrome biogenesis protein CcmI [Sinimarinibacterium sp. NLF-5-8]